MGVGMPVERAKDFRGTFRRLLGYLRPRMPQIVLVFIMAALSTVFAIVSPRVLGSATTVLFEGFMAQRAGIPGAGIDFGRIREILVLLSGLYIVSAFFAYLQQYIMAGVAQETVYELRKDVDAKLTRLPLRYYDAQPARRHAEPHYQRRGQHRQHAAAKFDPGHHVYRHRHRHRLHDVQHQPGAGDRDDGDAAFVGRRDDAHRPPLASALSGRSSARWAS